MCVWLPVPRAFSVTRSQSYDPNTTCDNHTPWGNPEFHFLFYSPPSLSNGKLRPLPQPLPQLGAREQCAQGAIALTFLPEMQRCWALHGLPGGLTLPCSSPRTFSPAGSAETGVCHFFRHHEDTLISFKKKEVCAGVAPKLIRC